MSKTLASPVGGLNETNAGIHNYWVKDLGAVAFSTASPAMRSNWQQHLFGALQRALGQMTTLPTDNELHLDASLASRALDVLGWISNSSDSPPPKLVNEEGTAVLFTWDDGVQKTYLCIEEEGIELEKRIKGMAGVDSSILAVGEAVDPALVLKALKLKLKASSGR